MVHLGIIYAYFDSYKIYKNVARNAFNTGRPKIPLYKDDALPIKNSTTQVCPPMTSGKVMFPIELMVLWVNLMSSVVFGLMFSGEDIHLIESVFEQTFAALLVSTRTRLTV